MKKHLKLLNQNLKLDPYLSGQMKVLKFISLLIIRLLEQKLDRKYSNECVINSLVKYTSTNLEHNIYLQSFRNDVIKDLEKIFNLDLSHKYLTLSQIKKILNF